MHCTCFACAQAATKDIFKAQRITANALNIRLLGGVLDNMYASPRTTKCSRKELHTLDNLPIIKLVKNYDPVERARWEV